MLHEMLGTSSDSNLRYCLQCFVVAAAKVAVGGYCVDRVVAG